MLLDECMAGTEGHSAAAEAVRLHHHHQSTSTGLTVLRTVPPMPCAVILDTTTTPPDSLSHAIAVLCVRLYQLTWYGLDQSHSMYTNSINLPAL